MKQILTIVPQNPVPNVAVESQAAPILSAQIEQGLDEHIRIQLEAHVAGLSPHLHLLANCRDDSGRAAECRQFQSVVQSLEKCAAAAGSQAIRREAAALDAFLVELASKPNHINDSRLRSLSLAVDVLGM